jgi:MOSC domain-containing protein YiiM
MADLVIDSPIPLQFLYLGTIGSLQPGEIASAIAKRPIHAAVAVNHFGLEGDQQADRRHHGGYDKALHHYPAEHYAAWRQELPDQAALYEPAGFGEKISTLGMTEADVCLGDVYRLGTAIVQVSQGRQPCAKLNLRFGVPDMLLRVMETGRTGWYYRVLTEGLVNPGDSLVLMDRPEPFWTLTRLWTVLFGDERDEAGLRILAGHPLLGQSWQERAARRLQG